MKEKRSICPMQKGDSVLCTPEQRTCDICGWNPTVAQARIEKYCKDNHIPLPRPQKEDQE